MNQPTDDDLERIFLHGVNNDQVGKQALLKQLKALRDTVAHGRYRSAVTGAVELSIADAFDGLPCSIKLFGAKGDTRKGTDGSFTAADPTFTSASAAFSVSDVGKKFCYQNPASQTSYTTTIASINARTSVELSDAAAESGTAARFIYGTDDTAAFHAALSSGTAEVFMPTGGYMLSDTIKVRGGQTLRGASPGVLPNRGAQIFPTSEVTGAVIESFDMSGNNYTHWLALRDFAIDASHQTGGTAAADCPGIKLYRMGEVAIVDRIMVTGTAGHGIYIYDYGTPVNIGFVSPHGCGHRCTDNAYGLMLHSSLGTHNSIGYVAGDNNKTALIGINRLYEATAFIREFKSERWDYGTVGHPYVIDLIQCDGGHVMIGQGRTWHSNVDSGRTVIRNAGGTTEGSMARVTVLGSIRSVASTSNNYASFYEDRTGNTIPLADYNGRTGPYDLRPNKTAGLITETSKIEDASHHVNTIGKYAGRPIFNSTTNKPLWASGATTNSPWVDGTGRTVHTPS